MIDSSAIYFRSPVWLQNLAVTAMGWRLSRRRYGRYGDLHARRLAESMHHDASRLRAHQEELFADLLAHAFRNVPYYRRLVDEQRDLAAHPPRLEDIERLPVIDKSILRSRSEEFLSEPSSFPGRSFTLGTSGTSGTPLKIYCDERARQLHYAFWTRLRAMQGLTPGDLRATFFGRTIVRPEVRTPPFWRQDRFQRNVLFSSYHLDEKTVPAYAAALRSIAPREVIGYPSSLFVLARWALRLGLTLPRPKVVMTTAETLLSHERETIERAFGTRVVDQYGCTEMVIFVAQCSHGSYHIHPEHGFLEILDDQGRPCAPGQVGEAVCTGFLNRAMPLIRYRLGDRLAAGRGRCPCGCAFPTIASLEGRTDDTLYAPDGRALTRLDPIFKTLSGIAETQIVQEERDLLAVRIVTDPGFDAKQEKQLVAEIRKRAGDEMRIRIERVDAIPKNANGKFRAVVSMINRSDADPVSF